MRRFVANSTDKNDFYSFFMPIVCHVWKRYIGYDPIAILQGPESSWLDTPKNEYVLQMVRQCAHTCFVEDVPGFRVSTVMQLSRMFASLLPCMEGEDYLLTSDVDMVPLSPSYFHGQDLEYRFNLFGADAYADISKGAHPPKYPMCYIGATAASWRSVLGTKSADVQGEVASALRGRLDCWDNDEMYFAGKLQSHPWYAGEFEQITGERFEKGACECIPRRWNPRASKRIDREVWFFNGETDMIDCHAYRPGYDSWELLLRILETYFSGSRDFFRCYVAQFLELKKAHG